MSTTDPNMPADGMPPVAPRKRHHYIRWTFAGLAALILLIAVISIAAGGKTKVIPAVAASTSPAATTAAQAIDGGGEQCAALNGAGYCPGDSPSPSPSPTVNSPTQVTFTVTGTGDPSITYGTDSDNRDGGGQLGQLSDGNGLPWTAALPFNGGAEYYYISAQLEGGGSLSCKITVTGPGDVPLVVSSGQAQGGYNICSAQAAPDSTGTSWQNER
jgi:hypothetical protein